MAVSIKAKFTPADIAKLMREKLQVIEAVILERLKFIGETFVRNARENGNYKDQTGNLRSSIGYVILKDGQQVFSGFKKVSGKRSGGKDGVNEAKRVVAEVASNFPKGYVLIVVAGMEYAAAVESKNYDVLTASSHIAEQDLKDAMESIRKKISGVKR